MIEITLVCFGLQNIASCVFDLLQKRKKKIRLPANYYAENYWYHFIRIYGSFKIEEIHISSLSKYICLFVNFALVDSHKLLIQ